jgi:hypothetical protein
MRTTVSVPFTDITRGGACTRNRATELGPGTESMPGPNLRTDYWITAQFGID